jgi:hypothetical protein
MPGKYLTAHLGIECFKIIFEISVFFSRESILNVVNVKKFSFDENHRYSIQLYIQLYCTIVEKKLSLDRVRF